jgi:hypothetical protein
MKISENTLAILNNLKNLNNSILFYPGKEIRHVSSDKSVYVTASIEEDIPNKFAVFSLRELLNVIAVIRDAEVEFRGDHLFIGNDYNSVVFRYTAPEVVEDVYARTMTLGDPAWEIQLSSEQIKNMFKMSAVLDIPDVKVVPSAAAQLVLYNARGSHSHNYSVNAELPTVGDAITFNISVLTLLDCAYVVSCYPKKNLIRFSGVELDIKYHIPFASLDR